VSESFNVVIDHSAVEWKFLGYDIDNDAAGGGAAENQDNSERSLRGST
jgi:hypothetical protein